MDTAEEINKISRQIKTQEKLKEIYKKELKEVLNKLPEKYHEYIKLFMKKEYKLLKYPAEYKARIPLKKEAILKQIKQRQKLQNELKLEQEFMIKFLVAGYI
jgi:hypothetical protein